MEFKLGRNLQVGDLFTNRQVVLVRDAPGEDLRLFQNELKRVVLNDKMFVRSTCPKRICKFQFSLDRQRGLLWCI